MHEANRRRHKKNDNGKEDRKDRKDRKDRAEDVQISKGKSIPKRKTETLSSLLKHFEMTLPIAYNLLETIPTLVTRTNLKESWASGFIKSNSKEMKPPRNSTEDNTKNNTENNTENNIETIATNTANFLEKISKELEESIKSIEDQKNQALSFARNSFLYLNSIHKDTCLGEAGKIMLELFDKGELTGDIIFGLLERAEEISKTKNLPFSNKLTTAQTKAINFMVEERDQRISPTVEELQSYSSLYSSALCWEPLLTALLNDNIKSAQCIVDAIPD